MKNIYLYIALLLSIFTYSQKKKKIAEYNTFIQEFNQVLDAVNQEQNTLQQYHQDLFRFYTLFDTLQISSYKAPNLGLDSLHIPPHLQKDFLPIQNQLQLFDSLTHSIHLEKDIVYSSEKVDSVNQRIKTLSKFSTSLQKKITELQKRLESENIFSTKNLHQLMLEEIKKIEFIIEKIKRKKKALHEIEYYVPEKIRVKLPPYFVALLDEFKTRLGKCQTANNKAEIIHYFMPEKYFDIWIMKKYNLKYWQVKYLEDVLIHPEYKKGLQTQYNTQVVKYEFGRLKNITPFESLEFTYIPPTNSPLGYHKDVFVILILDISNSMNEFDKLETLKQSVKEFVDALRPKDKFSILLFSNTSQELILPNDTDKEWIKYQIDKVKASGNTLPESAIYRAYNIMNLQTHTEFHNQVILVTDGIFQVTGKMKYHVKMGKKKNIRFSIFKIEADNEDNKPLEKLTEISDGKFYLIDNNQTYNTIIKEVLRE